MTQRLFFALWPDHEISRRLSQLAEESLSGVTRARPVTQDKLHLTLIFLGNSNSEVRQCYEMAAANTNGQAFRLDLEEITYRRRQQLLWIEALRLPAALGALLSQLSTNLVQCGYTPEQRSFLPHMTMARKVGKKITIQKIKPLSWQVSNFSLVESKTYQTGAEYQIIKTWPLQKKGG